MDDRILQKIKKCLGLSKSSNEHEAAIALRQARKLMDEHGVNDEDLALADIKETRTSAKTYFEPPFYKLYLASLVNAAFGTKYFFSMRSRVTEMVFIGRHPANEIAAYTYDVLLKQLEKSRTEFLKKNKRYKKSNRTRRANLFAEQWVSAVREKVIEFASKCPNTERLIDQYIEKTYTDLVPAKHTTITIEKSGDIDALIAGSNAAEDVTLNHGMSAETRKALN